MAKKAPKSQLEVTTMIARMHFPELQPLTQYLLIKLSVYSDRSGKGEAINPSLNTLASVTGLARSSVQKHLDILIKHGYVDKVSSGGVVNGQNTSSTYRLNLARLGLISTDEQAEVIPINTPRQAQYIAMDGTAFDYPTAMHEHNAKLRQSK